jgi:hypothetical protein
VSNLIEAFAKCRGKVLKRAKSGYVESLQTRAVKDRCRGRACYLQPSIKSHRQNGIYLVFEDKELITL